jgi:hypothetical protein
MVTSVILFEHIRFLVVNGKLMKKDAADASPVEYLDNVADMSGGVEKTP